MDLPARSRRQFLADAGLLGAAALAAGWTGLAPEAARPDEPLFKMSLAHWSFHKAIFGPSRDDYEWFNEALHGPDPDQVLQGTLDPRDLARVAREEFGLDAVDYVNQLFFGHAKDMPYLRDMKQRAEDHDVRVVVLMLDQLGNLGDEDDALRRDAIEAHRPWMDAAAFLGAQSVRVNASGTGSYLGQLHRSADSVLRLAEYGDQLGIDVLVENHGGVSNNGAWLNMLMELTAHPRVGTMVDFDNFMFTDWGERPERRYDRYQGMMEIAPYVKAVSPKVIAFDADGNEATIDFHRMMRIVLDTGYRGYVSLEYEGTDMSEMDGMHAMIRLMERVRADLTPEYA